MMANTTDGKVDTGPAFRALAQYIGVFGQPANEGRQAMAMTAPVTMTPQKPAGERMAMTAPVVQSEQKMGFVLPFNYTRLEDAPKPINDKVKLRLVPEKVVACRTFSGWYTHEVGRAQFKEL